MKRTYDTVLGKPSELVDLELQQGILAMDVTVSRGRAWMIRQFAPGGKLPEARDMTLLYKTAWMLFVTGAGSELRQVLDFAEAAALQPSGDLEFDEAYVDGQPYPWMIYRQAYVFRTASAVGHSLARKKDVSARMLQYQDERTGAVYGNVGRDRSDVVTPKESEVVSACLFGMWAIEVGELAAAQLAGRFVSRVVEQNASHMKAGAFFYRVDAKGDIRTTIAPGDDLNVVVRAEPSMQRTWVVGAVMAFLGDLYDAMAGGGNAAAAESVLATVRNVVEFADTFPVETYYTWNACKMAWGAGRLLDVLVRSDGGDAELYDKLYRAGRRTYMNTFLATRRPDGSWAHDRTPTTPSDPEAWLDQRVLEGLAAVPNVAVWREESGNHFLHEIEVTAEHVAWTFHLQEGFKQLRQAQVEGRVAGTQ